MLFDCGERLTDSGPEFIDDLTQCIQNVLLLRGLYLFLIKDVSGAAVLRAQTQNVLASEAGNGAFKDSGTPGPLANFPSELRGQPRIRLLAHETQCLLDPLVGDETEDW